MKFKVGDKVRCVKHTAAQGVHVGKVYTVKGYNDHCIKYGCVLLVEVDGSSPYEACLKLVQEAAVLTPEEVFEHLRKGTKLQVRDCGWQDKERHSTSFSEIINCKWRIKPEPEVIELNGKKYREIVD